VTNQIPRPTPAFEGQIERLIDDSTAAPLLRPEASTGPNIVLVMLDDVGFGTCGTFGGPVPTPTVSQLPGFATTSSTQPRCVHRPEPRC
jgi:hypothetical protein